MKRKLTLKELSCYLPYKLTYKDTLTGFEGIRTLRMSTINYCLNNGLLLLRQLSDLTKEIEVNGEKFVPMTKLLHMEGYKNFFEKNSMLKRVDDWSVIDCWWMNTEFDKKQKPYEFFTTWHLDRLTYSDAVQLFEWHFDVFNLIGAELAIDLNTIKNK